MQENKQGSGMKKLFSGMGGDKVKNIIIVAGLVGIALIFFSSFIKPSSQNQQEQEESATITAEEYADQLEKNLTEVISSIQGAGPSKVMVTLESGVQTKYATEEKTNSEASQDKDSNGETTRSQQSGDSEITYITVRDANGAERALEITEIQPTVKGVVVVCSGGEDPVVQQRVIDAVTTALNISSKRVCVTR